MICLAYLWHTSTKVWWFSLVLFTAAENQIQLNPVRPLNYYSVIAIVLALLTGFLYIWYRLPRDKSKFSLLGRYNCVIPILHLEECHFLVEFKFWHWTKQIQMTQIWNLLKHGQPALWSALSPFVVQVPEMSHNDYGRSLRKQSDILDSKVRSSVGFNYVHHQVCVFVNACLRISSYVRLMFPSVLYCGLQEFPVV